MRELRQRRLNDLGKGRPPAQCMIIDSPGQESDVSATDISVTNVSVTVDVVTAVSFTDVLVTDFSISVMNTMISDIILHAVYHVRNYVM